MKGKRRLPEINTGSFADISFLLLIFFLVVTTIQQDEGIYRKLPSLDVAPPAPVHDRNILFIQLNDSDEMLVDQEYMDISQLRKEVKEFLSNPDQKDHFPLKKLVNERICEQNISKLNIESTDKASLVSRQLLNERLDHWKVKAQVVKLVGPYFELPPSTVITIQTGTSTSYGAYIEVQNEVSAALFELRNELCLAKFGTRFDQLDKRTRSGRAMIKTIKTVYPQMISEAEPVDVN